MAGQTGVPETVVPEDLFRAVEVYNLSMRQTGLPEYVGSFDVVNKEVETCDGNGVPCDMATVPLFALPNAKPLVNDTDLPGLSLRTDAAEHRRDFKLPKPEVGSSVDLRAELASIAKSNLSIKVPATNPAKNPLSMDEQFPTVLSALQATLFPTLTSLAHIKQSFCNPQKGPGPAEKTIRAWFCYKLPAATRLPPDFALFNDKAGHFSLFPTGRIGINLWSPQSPYATSQAILEIPQWQLHCFILKASAKPQDLKDDDHGGFNPLHRVATLIYEHFHQLPEGDVDLALHVQEMLAQVQYRPSRVTPDGLAHVRLIVDSLCCTDADVDGLVF
jgi:hypothetical protein